MPTNPRPVTIASIAQSSLLVLAFLFVSQAWSLTARSYHTEAIPFRALIDQGSFQNVIVKEPSALPVQVADDKKAKRVPIMTATLPGLRGLKVEYDPNSGVNILTASGKPFSGIFLMVATSTMSRSEAMAKSREVTKALGDALQEKMPEIVAAKKYIKLSATVVADDDGELDVEVKVEPAELNEHVAVMIKNMYQMTIQGAKVEDSPERFASFVEEVGPVIQATAASTQKIIEEVDYDGDKFIEKMMEQLKNAPPPSAAPDAPAPAPKTPAPRKRPIPGTLLV